MVERRGAAGVVGEQARELGLEGRIRARLLVGRRQLVERRDQRLGDVAPAVRAESGLDGHVTAPPEMIGAGDDAEERTHESGLFDARGALDAARDVDGVGTHELDGAVDVGRQQAAGQHEALARQLRGRERPPVEPAAGAAVVVRRARIEQDQVGGGGVLGVGGGDEQRPQAAAQRRRAHVGDARTVGAGRELDGIEAARGQRPGDPVRVLGRDDGHRQAVAAQGGERGGVRRR